MKNSLPARYPSQLSQFLAMLIFLAHPTSQAAEILTGRVIGIHDGDTITLLTSFHEVKIRLAQIDAPESAQAFGQRSKQSLARMVFGKFASVTVETYDKYDRVVGTVFVDGVDVNREQIRRGMAWAYRQYLQDASLLDLEAQARAANRGLWVDSNPTPPWDWRHEDNHTGNGETRPNLAWTTITTQSSFCGSKTKCKQMSTCEEAKRYLINCHLPRLDKDGDGTPCESLCNSGR